MSKKTFTMPKPTKNKLNTLQTIQNFDVTPTSTIWDGSNYIC